MTAPSAKLLFRAMKAKARAAPQPDLMQVSDSRKPAAARRVDDYYPTGQPEAIRAVFRRLG